MVTIRHMAVAYSILVALLIGYSVSFSSPAEASTGSITVGPGETKYVSFGECTENDLLLWDLTIDTLSTVFTCWLETPDDAHLSLESMTWGRVILTPGEWRIGFSIDASGWWSATVYYEIYRTAPSIVIEEPTLDACVNEASLIVAGGVDEFASQVAVSTDNVHYEPADLYLGAWNTQVTLPVDGEYTIYTEGIIVWGGYSVKYYDTVTVTRDTLAPEVSITEPDADAKVSKDMVTISWNGMDTLSGIDHYEVKVDGGIWIDVGTDTEYTITGLDDGWYRVAVKAVDKAGNSAESSVMVGVYTSIWSTDGPYDGIPLFAAIAAAAMAALLSVLLYRRKRGGAAVTTVPEEGSAPKAD